MYIKKIGITLLIVFCELTVNGQVQKSDTVYTIGEIVVRSSRLQNFAVGSSLQKIDSLSLSNYFHQSFSDLLNAQSLLMLNSYGSGGLSMPSVRGGGGAHTAVILNGINIQSPMNGSSNMALMPANLFGRVDIQYGGSGTLFGSGAMSGAIHLESPDLFQQTNQMKFSWATGSFGLKNYNASTKIGNESLASSFQFYQHKSENDFKYRNIAKYQTPVETQTNAGLNQSGFFNQTKIKTSKSSDLSSFFWYQKFDKELQTLMTASDTSRSNQTDQNIYAILRWQQSASHMSLSAKSAFINDIQKFVNPVLAEPITNNRALSIINEIEMKWMLSEKQMLNAGLNYTYEEVSSEGYRSLANRNRISFFVSHKLLNLFDKLDVVNSIRKEIVDMGALPFVYSLDLNYAFNNDVAVHGNISKNYSLPSMNDLFWRSETFVSGNPDLKAESGWSGEIGFSEHIHASRPSIILEQNFYTSIINDWIVWLPAEKGVWKPENKKTGRSQGMDLGLKIEQEINRSSLQINVKYNWNSSTFNEKESEELPMIYVPKSILLINVVTQFEKWNLSYDHKFVSRRLYDHAHYLAAFHLGNLMLNYSVEIFGRPLSLALKINNIWNVDYQVMAWYAMPPANYMFSVSYRIEKN